MIKYSLKRGLANYKLQIPFHLFSSKPANSDDTKIKLPPHPTIDESFGTKFTPKQIEKLIDPIGFLNE